MFGNCYSGHVRAHTHPHTLGDSLKRQQCPIYTRIYMRIFYTRRTCGVAQDVTQGFIGRFGYTRTHSRRGCPFLRPSRR